MVITTESKTLICAIRKKRAYLIVYNLLTYPIFFVIVAGFLLSYILSTYANESETLEIIRIFFEPLYNNILLALEKINALPFVAPALHPIKDTPHSTVLNGFLDYTVKKILPSFPRAAKFDDYALRITVFRHSKSSMYKNMSPFSESKIGPSTYLESIARSGKSTIGRRRIFPTTNNGILKNGVVGKAWNLNMENLEVKVHHSIDMHSALEKKLKYIEKTNLEKEAFENWLNSKIGEKIPVYFYGCQIKVAGKPWGVLLLDSCCLPDQQQQMVDCMTDLLSYVTCYLEGQNGKKKT